jgi:hypothetical protein
MAEARPSASVAVRWIWDDLKSLGLGSGHLPAAPLDVLLWYR